MFPEALLLWLSVLMAPAVGSELIMGIGTMLLSGPMTVPTLAGWGIVKAGNLLRVVGGRIRGGADIREKCKSGQDLW